MSHIRVGIITYTVDVPPDRIQEISARTQAELVPQYRSFAGFRSFQAFPAGPRVAVVITTWDSAAQADAATQMAQNWLQQTSGSLVANVQNYVGDVTVSS